ncbi:HAD family hydrolase [Enhygromyxa salina]|uniref:phosphoglycolate phosphatase n=1 Tax=Enhygromyxa salina TaxID=215803 RepID=A0A2S9XUP6_9BACT|nr:HAD-IA family hydrolase [Enhygromyxa salina]PRP96460.1 Phosphoglycolate phosphatase [Enhygromyxa salina]
MSRPVIQLLVTDLDNTLYDWVGFFAKAFRAMVDEAVSILGVERERLLDDLKLVHEHHHDSERPWSLLETRAVMERLAGYDYDARKAQLEPAFHAFNSARKRYLRLYDGVAETLAMIRASGVPIVAHTEASTVNALFRVKRLGLTESIGRVYAADAGDGVESDDVELVAIPREIHKPDPRILLEICNEYGVAPQRTLYVGDSISRDIAMAQQISMHAAWAAYGTRHDRHDWATLVRVSHWTQADVDRVRHTQERFGDVKPKTCLESFGELPAHFEFRGFAPAATSSIAGCGG